jgi:hypothetical protein
MQIRRTSQNIFIIKVATEEKDTPKNYEKEINVDGDQQEKG